uniref:Cytochrome b5 heme-binding domain-containing protein n=1 Tax=Arcella intermedia TaxID=1963864 RepID=A0A6B2L7C9_9EUKA
MWVPLLLVSLIHFLTVVGFVWFPISWQGLKYALVMYFYSGFGITVGYHRLWSHRTYKGNWLWRLFWAIGGTSSLQGSIRWWCRLHRLHHSFPDTEVDPYGPNKGFWYSHVLWIFHKKDRKEELSKVNIQDIEKDPIALWVSVHYPWLSLTVAFLLPLLMFSDKTQAFFYGGCLARIITWHSTWCVNSLAHWLGSDEYSNETSAKDHLITALLTFGEGNHGFHHAFPGSYINGIRWWDYDPTKWVILAGSWLGLCQDLGWPDDNEVLKAKYQVKHKKLQDLNSQIRWPNPPNVVMTLEEYQRVAKAEGLVALGDTIYKVDSFLPEHPGGKALINSAVGMEPAKVEALMKNKHTHTMASKNFLQTMAIAKLADQ